MASELPHPHAEGFESGDWCVVPLSPERVMQHWGEIDSALDFAPEVWNILDTKESIYQALVGGLSVCWAVFEGTAHRSMMFTRVLDFPSGVRVVRIWGMMGELGDSVPLMADAIRAYGLRCGAHFIEVEGRKGWERVLGQFGLKPDRLLLRAPLIERMH